MSNLYFFRSSNILEPTTHSASTYQINHEDTSHREKQALRSKKYRSQEHPCYQMQLLSNFIAKLCLLDAQTWSRARLITFRISNFQSQTASHSLTGIDKPLWKPPTTLQSATCTPCCNTFASRSNISFRWMLTVNNN